MFNVFNERKNQKRAFLARSAFTLAELLVVIVIISLLMAILMPVIGTVLNRVYHARTMARIAGLSNGTETFKQERQFYPGQEDIETWEDTYAGSQVLAAHMFGYYDEDNNDYDDIELENPEPKSPYAAYTEGALMNIGAAATERNFLADAFPNQSAIAYYPSTGSVGIAQFKWSHNSVFTGGESTDFETYIKNDQIEAGAAGAIPYNNERFLLLAPGIDGKYFNDDDARNW